MSSSIKDSRLSEKTQETNESRGTYGTVLLYLGPSIPVSGPISVELAKNITAVVGLREAITSESRCMRCVWTVLLALALGATAFYLTDTIQEFADSPRATVVCRSCLSTSDAYVLCRFVLGTAKQ